MTSALHYLDLTELSHRIHAREISPVEVTTAELTRIERLDGSLKSYAHMMAEAALVQACAAEAEIMRGEMRARSTACRSRSRICAGHGAYRQRRA